MYGNDFRSEKLSFPFFGGRGAFLFQHGETSFDRARAPHLNTHVSRTRSSIVHHGTSMRVGSLASASFHSARAPASTVSLRSDVPGKHGTRFGPRGVRPAARSRAPDRHRPRPRDPRERVRTTFAPSERPFARAFSRNALHADRVATSRVRVPPTLHLFLPAIGRLFPSA
jgi:hypothetical protein